MVEGTDTSAEPLSENVMGAGNQQERLSDNTQNPQRLYAGLAEAQRDDIVRTAWRHAELGRNDQTLTDSNL